MKLSKDEFKTLQLHWYDKLASTGFKDIEKIKGDELVLSQSAAYCFRNIDALTRFLKAEYYRVMAQMAQDEATKFRNEIDRHILMRHAEGAKIKVIVEELRDMRTPRDRNSVRFIIRRYEMLWGFRVYDYKQLHKKKP